MKNKRTIGWNMLFLMTVAQLSWANDSWLKDTIFINVNDALEKFVTHKVAKKQTLFSLANAYGLDLYDVYDHNPILKSRILMADDNLKMPLYDHHIITDKSLLAEDKKYRPVMYLVKAKDNMYKVAKSYFNISFDDLMNRNQLKSPNLKVNQLLLIGWFDNTKKENTEPDAKPSIAKTEQANLEQKFSSVNPAPYTEEYKAIDLVPSEWTNKYSSVENTSDRLIDLKTGVSEINIKERKVEKVTTLAKPTEAAKSIEKPLVLSRSILNNPNVNIESKPKVLKRKMVTQNGVAQWVKTENTSSDLYVLHPTAPINSVVEITNPMTHRKIYAKVISNMPPRLYSDDISVVVSPGVANLLGVIDSRFYVKLRYVEETIQ